MVGFVDDDAVLGGFFDFGDDDGAFVAMGFVEVGELLKGIIANDVGVEYEERGVVFAEGFFGELEGTSGSEGFGFDGEFNVDLVFFLVLGANRELWLELWRLVVILLSKLFP